MVTKKEGSNHAQSALTHYAAALRKLVLLPNHISAADRVLPPATRTGAQFEVPVCSQFLVAAEHIVELVFGRGASRVLQLNDVSLCAFICGSDLYFIRAGAIFNRFILLLPLQQPQTSIFFDLPPEPFQIPHLYFHPLHPKKPTLLYSLTLPISPIFLPLPAPQLSNTINQLILFILEFVDEVGRVGLYLLETEGIFEMDYGEDFVEILGVLAALEMHQIQVVFLVLLQVR